ncbi:MAG: hypothetical protein HC933_19180 [Pleurocapsa sp. SU_196_0]|nr:hypothetical protein [Pleurocapsa sp. SU_196_0]
MLRSSQLVFSLVLFTALLCAALASSPQTLVSNDPNADARKPVIALGKPVRPSSRGSRW